MTDRPARLGEDRPGIELVLGDITTEQVDAVVNSADSSLLGGSGVDGAIHAAAGPELLQACRELRRTDLPDGLRPGEAVATTAGGLPCRYVIHVLGPDRRIGQTDPELLRTAFRRVLDVAVDLGCSTVAIPAVGAGVFGWTPDDVAGVAVRAALAHPRDGIDLVRFVLFTEDLYSCFVRALQEETS